MTTRLFVHHIFVLLCICLLCHSACAQIGGNVLAASKYSSEERLHELIDNALARDIDLESDGELARHYHLLSSCYFYLGEEEVAKYYLLKSLEFDPKFVCHFARLNVKRDLPEAQYLTGSDPTAYFVSEMDDEIVQEFFRRCAICCHGGEDKHAFEIVQRNPIDRILLKARIRDQKYRGPYGISNEKAQNQLDEENRNVLDSLYDQTGFPGTDHVNQESIHIVWLIWHHSTDCKWNAIWLERLLKHVELGDFPLEFIPLSIEQKYNEETGTCMQRKKNRTLKWLDEMKQKYDEAAFELIDSPSNPK